MNERIKDLLHLEGLEEGSLEYEFRELQLRTEFCAEANHVESCADCNVLYFCQTVAKFRRSKRRLEDARRRDR